MEWKPPSRRFPLESRDLIKILRVARRTKAKLFLSGQLADKPCL